MIRKFQLINWDQLNQDLSQDKRLQSASTATDVNTISENLLASIQDNIDHQQRQQRIQISNKYPAFASNETRDTIKLRDQYLKQMKTTNNDDDIRQYKTLRNKVHKLLRQDKELDIKNKFQEMDGDSRQTWNYTKNLAGWNKNLSPQILSVEGKTITDPKGIANAINLAQITRNIKLHRQVPKTNTDHKTNYKKLIQNKNLKFALRHVSMGEMLNSIREMKPTPSSGVDGVSIKTLKRILKPIAPTMLNLVNTCMTTAEYPKNLKTARVIPLLKKDKPPTDPLSFRAINILPSIGKIIDRIINKQITRHLVSNNLLLQQHNGSIKGRSTMSAVLTMLDEWSEDLENHKNNAILILDQSAAYDIICHVKLVEKLKLLGFDRNSLEFIKSYLNNRDQTVTVESFQSDTLDSGPMSVCQGSTLSGIFYLIYTLDYPLIHVNKIQSTQQYEESNAPKTTTFVDDSICKIQITDNTTHNNNEIIKTLDKITNYMNSNSLVLNKDKSQLLIISENPEIKKGISIPIKGKEKPIKPTNSMKYLGINIQDDMKWNCFLQDGKDNLIKKTQTKNKCSKKYQKIHQL